MEKTILKHLTIHGFVKGKELTNCELLENKLALAKDKLKQAKKDVSNAKKELNRAVEESLKKIESEKTELKNIRNNDTESSTFSKVFSKENLKVNYEEAMNDLELKKNEIKKKIEGFKTDGSEKWDSFKHKLNDDLEELGKALKGFTTHSN